MISALVASSLVLGAAAATWGPATSTECNGWPAGPWITASSSQPGHEVRIGITFTVDVAIPVNSIIVLDGLQNYITLPPLPHQQIVADVVVGMNAFQVNLTSTTTWTGRTQTQMGFIVTSTTGNVPIPSGGFTTFDFIELTATPNPCVVDYTLADHPVSISIAEGVTVAAQALVDGFDLSSDKRACTPSPLTLWCDNPLSMLVVGNVPELSTAHGGGNLIDRGAYQGCGHAPHGCWNPLYPLDNLGLEIPIWEGISGFYVGLDGSQWDDTKVEPTVTFNVSMSTENEIFVAPTLRRCNGNLDISLPENVRSCTMDMLDSTQVAAMGTIAPGFPGLEVFGYLELDFGCIPSMYKYGEDNYLTVSLLLTPIIENISPSHSDQAVVLSTIELWFAKNCAIGNQDQKINPDFNARWIPASSEWIAQNPDLVDDYAQGLIHAGYLNSTSCAQAAAYPGAPPVAPNSFSNGDCPSLVNKAHEVTFTIELNVPAASPAQYYYLAPQYNKVLLDVSLNATKDNSACSPIGSPCSITPGTPTNLEITATCAYPIEELSPISITLLPVLTNTQGDFSTNAMEPLIFTVYKECEPGAIPGPTSAPYGPTPLVPKNDDGGMSPAGVFFLVVFILTVVGFAVGAVVKYHHQGARGIEVVPFIDSFRRFGNWCKQTCCGGRGYGHVSETENRVGLAKSSSGGVNSAGGYQSASVY